jgi:hypothetical protein
LDLGYLLEIKTEDFFSRSSSLTDSELDSDELFLLCLSFILSATLPKF